MEPMSMHPFESFFRTALIQNEQILWPEVMGFSSHAARAQSRPFGVCPVSCDIKCISRL